jgi:hypothetical protein
MTTTPPHHVTLGGDLAQDLADALMLIARGGIPSPERAAVLLQRLNTAIRNIERKPIG